MLFVSSRVNLDNEDQVGLDESFWEVDDGSGGSAGAQQKDLAAIQEACAQKRVLLLVHGYNNEFEDVLRAYRIIREKQQQFLSRKYDLVLGYTWPGGIDALDYRQAKRRAGIVGPRLGVVLLKLTSGQKKIKTLDVMTHSMGARVGFRALESLDRAKTVRNFFLMASAVDNESIEPDQEYFASNRLARNSFVFHSRHDVVLRFGFPAFEFDAALGLQGPENPAAVIEDPPQTYVVNCKERIRAHGEYKSEDAIYEFLGDNVEAPQADQFSTL